MAVDWEPLALPALHGPLTAAETLRDFLPATERSLIGMEHSIPSLLSVNDQR
jgi:hypothetical protein